MWHLETIEKFNIIKEVNMMTVCKNRNLLAGGLMLLSLMLFSGAAVAVPQFGKCYSLSYGTWNGQKWGHLELSPAWTVDVLSRRVPPYFIVMDKIRAVWYNIRHEAEATYTRQCPVAR